MNRKISGLLMVLCCGALMAGGCAKNQVIKKEEPVASVAPVAAPAPPAKAQPDIKEPAQTPAAQKPIQESGIPNAVETAGKLDPSEELKEGLEQIYFDFDSASLSEQARISLAKNAALIRKVAKAKIRVEGNCDERGSDDYNLALGEKRARGAVQYLTSLGVPPEQMTVISYGKEKPVAAGHDEGDWAKNRRDEFCVIQ